MFSWLFFFAGRDLEGPTAVKPTPGHKFLKSLRPSTFIPYIGTLVLTFENYYLTTQRTKPYIGTLVLTFANVSECRASR